VTTESHGETLRFLVSHMRTMLNHTAYRMNLTGISNGQLTSIAAEVETIESGVRHLRERIATEQKRRKEHGL
jgi:hypothetical protein